MISKVAVILSGCGVFDGAEIQESVFALLALEQRGIAWQCYAPDILQHHVINHMTGEEMPEKRNVMIEASRIVRGDVKALDTLDVQQYDALLIPGGFGVAKNLSDFAFQGQTMKVDDTVLQVCKGFKDAGKPAAYACIAPALLTEVYGKGINLTIGDDPETARTLEAMGARHQNCEVNNTVVDEQHKVVTTPAYMLAKNINEAWLSLDSLVAKLVKM